MKEQSIRKKIIWLTLFSIAMGFMETVIVVYLRKIYYPHGFDFPLVAMDLDILKAEVWREVATVIMLVAIGMLTGKTASEKFAFFILCFAIWDIFYYVFLKLLLGWPESLLTWDILFLIPVPWVGPVLAPCLVSITMIILAGGIVYYSSKGYQTEIKRNEWLTYICGSIIIILSFSIDTLKFISVSPEQPVTAVPTVYSWWIFCLGELMIVMGILIFVRRMKWNRK
jgi:hypothetical protein